MSDYRQMVVDAAVRELRHQLGDDEVNQSGSYVQVESGFRMGRVAEYVLRTGIDPSNKTIIEEVAQTLAGFGNDWRPYEGDARDVITAVWGAVVGLMDPLP